MAVFPKQQWTNGWWWCIGAPCERLGDKRQYIIENYSNSIVLEWDIRARTHWCCFYELNINSDCDLKCFQSCKQLKLSWLITCCIPRKKNLSTNKFWAKVQSAYTNASDREKNGRGREGDRVQREICKHTKKADEAYAYVGRAACLAPRIQYRNVNNVTCADRTTSAVKNEQLKCNVDSALGGWFWFFFLFFFFAVYSWYCCYSGYVLDYTFYVMRIEENRI